VEDGATMADLADLGIALQQGFHIARPMPAAQVEAWVKQWSRRGPVRPRSPGGVVSSDDVGVKLR